MIEFPSQEALVRKYDVPTPRYTSYPTVPHWNTDSFSSERWIHAVRTAFEETNDSHGISLYLHLPFCERLCTYCACNKRITKNHDVEIGYIRTLLKEWSFYLRIFGRKPLIRELHLGGGTPTFFSPRNLKWLVSYLLEEGDIHNDHAFSFEGHPNNTTPAHLRALYDLGFSRVSFGVQDLDPKVQKTINRIQPFENLEAVTRVSRSIGYASISFDLIYGLPFQTPQTIGNTIQKVLSLRPDRVSFYSYAHVPWVTPGQRGYSEADLPTGIFKRRLYETGRRLLRENGYEDIGMDHFALVHDTLFRAQAQGRLHRNFMGYTTTQTALLIGLGASAISDARYGYAQNTKKVEAYTEAVSTGRLPVFKGHMHEGNDQEIKQLIFDIACRGEISNESLRAHATPAIADKLHAMENEGILRRGPHGLLVTDFGRAFIRNICSLFDKNIQREKQENTVQLFSKSI